MRTVCLAAGRLERSMLRPYKAVTNAVDVR